MKYIRLGVALVTGWLVAGSLLSAQIEFHGNVYPLVRLTFENRYLNLPHRIISLEGYNRGRNVSLYFNTTLEYRLATNSAVIELQEAYAEFSTSRGDFRFGQQIVAWGTADGNNPTDNVNPYDFYYLFMPGTDRKVGNVMAVAKLYLGAVNLDVVVTPVFQPNRLPVNEPDFPILSGAGLAVPSKFYFDGSIVYVNWAPPSVWPENRPSRDLQNTETGLRLRLPLSMLDLSVSYFRGFDRMFTPKVTVVSSGSPPDINITSEYYATQVFGGDVVTFLGDWAVRAEGAYFLTEDKDGTDPNIRNPYLQYVIQLDRMLDNSNLVVQYLGTAITMVDGDSVLDFRTGRWIGEKQNERDNIPPKMGMPFAAIAQNAVMATVSRDFADGRYSLQANALYELDHKGYMAGGKVTIAVEEAFDLELGAVYLGGEEGSRLATIGEVFSHFYMGMKYSF